MLDAAQSSGLPNGLERVPHFPPPLLCVGEGGAEQEGREAYYLGAVGGHGLHGHPVWHLGQAYLVGVLLGYHGARHLLHHVRHGDGHVRLLCTNAPGKT